ncbi:hypothetical protein [Ramlibacter sp.]|uniref:hypothetical protein n=1 Tax=Ramlibacter sp. TaxID=1917967 RepID=UPI003D0D1828
MMLALQILASGFALLGTYLLRKPGPAAPWGFVAWLVSNPAAMTFMALQGNWVFFAQHLVFFILAVDGTWNWLVAPRLCNDNNRGQP